MDPAVPEKPSLEALVESETLPLEVLHPGGSELSRELARACGVGQGVRVLDVASGTGETACLLAEEFGSRVFGVDRAPRMIERAARKAAGRGLTRVAFVRADAHQLPFRDASFEVAISECTLSLLDKRRALREMVRAVRPGGRVGVHEVCWKEATSEDVKRRLLELEGERPERLADWKRLFEEAGLREVRAEDCSELIPRWIADSRRRLGPRGLLRVARRVLSRWGVAGLRRVLASERLFRSGHVGYGMLVGIRP